MGSKQDKKLIVLVYYPRDDWVLRLFDIFFAEFIPDGLSYTFEYNVHEDIMQDTKMIKYIEKCSKRLVFLRAVYGVADYINTDSIVFNDNCSFMLRRFGTCYPMLDIEPQEYHTFSERNYMTVSDILFDEFNELSKCFTRVTGETLTKEDKDKDDEADSEAEPEKEKEKQDDVTSEEPEPKKMKTTEEN